MIVAVLPPIERIKGVWAGQAGEITYEAAEISTADIILIAGPPGDSSGIASYLHIQTEPSVEWIVNHNLARFVNVEVTDLADNTIGANIARVSLNQVRVAFVLPFIGKVFVR
jgi:hypothetical protein